MARVNVEQKALTDPRFCRLGMDLGASPEHAHAVGLFTMVRVWNECIERGRYVLDGWVIQAIVGKTDGADLVASCDLSVPLAGNRFRVRGTKGRVEYLEEKRKLARINGQKGGRPRKPTSVSEITDVGVPGKTPPAPAPAPAPEPKTQSLGARRGGPHSRTPFVPPTVEEVAAYVATRPVKIDSQRFVDHYTANGWVQGRQGKPVRDWKACVRTWEGNNFGGNGRQGANVADQAQDNGNEFLRIVGADL